MSNPSGRVGREGENKALDILAEAGFTLSEERGDGGLEREGRRAKSLDIIGDDLRIPIEVRRRARWDTQAWVRELRDRHGGTWALFAITRDARRKDAPPSIMIYPAALGALALKRLHEAGDL